MQALSLAAFGLAALLALAFGARYVLTREFMPYHATVLGSPWATLEPRLQVIILGMLKVAGGGLLGYGVALLWLLLPIHRQEPWAAWAALTVSLVVVVPILYVVVWLRRIEPTAKTPLVPCLVVLALVAVGSAASLVRW
jgi:ABC-type polysaccharide/polyol phosphate export permease